ncbi:hypothetical protein [uncultured Tateyamaria sp.]|uniref:hypothetical protein n=1 Tax=uncultured Tateyamaria sp. TaxID=455651 RepID=UPI002601A3C0|nr:hypothetical protein [uncultured Tateyamaria sp.]
MQALIIDRQAARLDHCQIALMNAGVQVTGTGSLLVAETCITRMGVDLLVIEKTTIGDALGDTLGMAEERNPNLVAILRTPDVADDQDSLSPHFPSLHCVVGQDVSNEVAIKLGLASLRAQATRSVMPARAVRLAPKTVKAMPVPAAYAAGTAVADNIFSEVM